MADEYESLTSSRRSHKPRGYGAAVPSTATSLQPKSVTITHKVTKSDSLTSLAIRYNSTVADIKRTNKLWNNEALSFRDTISIPVYDDSGQLPVSEASGIHVTLTSPEAANSVTADISPEEFFDKFDDFSSLAAAAPVHLSPSKLEQQPATLTSNGITGELGGSNNDFFAKFDQSLSFLKKKVENQAASSTQYMDGDLSTHSSHVHLRDKVSNRLSQNGGSNDTSSIRSSRSSIRSMEDVRTTPEPVIRAKVKKKLEQHKERQDELFSL